MKNPNEYEALAKKLAPYNVIMCNAADTILNEEISSYPIFIIPPQGIALGIPLLETGEDKAIRIYASTLEELATKNVIEMERVNNFRKVYKDPGEFLCLFVIGEQDASFVFIPRQAVDN